MKIIYIHQHFRLPSQNGGTRSFDFSSEFIKAGHEVSVLTTRSDYGFIPIWNMEIHNGMKVYYCNINYSNEFGKVRRVIAFLLFTIFSTLKSLRLDGDVTIATSTPLTVGLPAIAAYFLRKRPYIFEVRDVWPEAVIAIGAVKSKFIVSILEKLELLLYRYAMHIVPLSTDMKDSIDRRTGAIYSNKTTVIENISELNRFRSYIPKKHLIKQLLGFTPRFTILYAGTFGQVNNLSYVVELATFLKEIDSTIVFILLGDGAEKKDIEKKAVDTGTLGLNVFILDAISKSELPQLYYECSMGSSFVAPIPELWANSANKFFDTLAAQKPILINHNGWQRNLIKKENIGYVLPFEMTEECAKKFADYTLNLDSLQEQSLNSLTVARERFSLEVLAEKYLAIVNKVKFFTKN